KGKRQEARGKRQLLRQNSCPLPVACCLRLLQAPVQAAAAAGFGRVVGLVALAELAVAVTVPDGVEATVVNVAEDQVVVGHVGEGRDAARQGVAVGGDVAKPPGSAAALPGVANFAR